LELLTLSWSSSAVVLQNYIRYPDAFKSVLAMLSESKINPEVYELHLQMIKSLISKVIHEF
jgi:hypothetical protein